MPRKVPWPPPVYHRGESDVIRLRLAPGKYRDVTLGPSGSAESRQEYARIVAEVEAHGRVLGVKGDVTVAELAAAYLAVAEREMEFRSYARARRAFKGVCALYSRTKAIDFGPLALQTVRAQWVGERLSRRYVNKLVTTVRAAWRWAVAAEMLPGDRAAALGALSGLRRGKSQAKEREKVRPVDLHQVEAVLPHLPPIVADLARLQLATGMRPGEACQIRPCDIVRPWKVVDGVEVWLYRLDEHKNDWRGHHRWIPLGPRAQEILAPYLDRRKPDAYCFSPKEVTEQWCRENGRTVGRRRGRQPGLHYTTQALDKVVRRACSRAFPPPQEVARRAGEGLGGKEDKTTWLARIGPAGVARLKAWEQEHSWRPNQLRHTRATEIETAYGREDARCVLGHKNPTVTAIYAESVDRAAKVMAAIG